MKVRLIAMEATGSAEVVGQLAAAVLEGQGTMEIAAAYLRTRGHHVVLADGPIPGLWLVDGREVTERQLLDIASRS